jgi:repressor LexA
VTPRQRSVYNAISGFISEKRYAPTVREIGALVGLTSSATVVAHLRALQKKGFISWDPLRPRTIQIRRDAP